jgi:hypothetical protein
MNDPLTELRADEMATLALRVMELEAESARLEVDVLYFKGQCNNLRDVNLRLNTIVEAMELITKTIREQVFEEVYDWLDSRHEATLAFGLRRALANKEGEQ